MLRRATGLAATVAALAVGCGGPPSSQPSSPEAPRQPRQPPAATPSPPVAPDSIAPARGDPPPAQTSAAWVDPRGTSIVGFGLLRLVPGSVGSPATFRIRYREIPDSYALGTATAGNLQLFVLPGDAFATSDRAYADRFLAFTRTEDEGTADDSGALRLETTVAVADESTVIVAYGPWTAPDAGRPAGDEPTFRIDVTSADGTFEWIESEAGELITTNWTNRPGVARGGPVRDPVAGADAWIEVRPMILYDARLVRAADEPPGDAAALAPGAPTPETLRAEAAALDAAGDAARAADRRERAADLSAHLARADGRIVLTRELAEKFRRVPIRGR